jgi:outer membrane protein OmpA-like peptidoglycan-associated protein
VIRRRLGIATVAFIVVGAPALNAQEERVTDLVPRVVDLVARTSRFGATTTESARRVEIVVAADVLFRFDSWDLTPRARRTLQDAAEQIESKAIGFVRIEGHTDSKGMDFYNIVLSRRRATAVRHALDGLLRPRISFRTFAYGERRPIAPNTKRDGSDNPKGRAKNRRVVIKFRK